MARLSVIAATTMILLLSVAPASAQEPETVPPVEIDWRAAAIVDIEAAYTAFKNEHPGYHDPANPDSCNNGLGIFTRFPGHQADRRTVFGGFTLSRGAI